MGKTRDLFKKIRDTKEKFHTKMAIIKDRNHMVLTEAKGKVEKERYIHLKAEFKIIARRNKKAFLSEQRKKKKIEDNNRMGKRLKALQENQRY